MSESAQNLTPAPPWDPKSWQETGTFRGTSLGAPAWRTPFFLSVLAHALVAALFGFLWTQTLGPFAPSQRPSKKTVWIDLAPPAVPASKTTPPPRTQRIVQTEPGRLTEKAAPDALLGERTQTVDRQTVSRTRNAPTPAQRSASTAAPAPLSQFGVRWSKPGQILTQPAAPKPQWSQQGADPHPGTSRAQDYIKGLKEGEQTALNTREFVFYSYFQRIRSNLDRAWNKTLRENLARFFRRGRHLASEVDHTTRTLVVLNGQGRVLRVQVLEESGTLDLDDAAVRAFNEAGPFPNPPRGLVDASGEIQVRWDFVLRN